MIDTDLAIQVLNEALEQDRGAIEQLVAYRVDANQALKDHPTIQVTADGKVGVLGILNALMEGLGGGRVAACFDEAGSLVGFTKYEIHED